MHANLNQDYLTTSSSTLHMFFWKVVRDAQLQPGSDDREYGEASGSPCGKIDLNVKASDG